MPKLNDTQTILLSHAAQQTDLSLYPLAATHASAGTRVTKAIAGLLASGLVEERQTSTPDQIARNDGDLGYGLFATPAGLQAIGIEPEEAGQAREEKGGAEPPASRASGTTKAATVLALLQAQAGRHVARADRGDRLAAAHHARCTDRPTQEGPRARQS